MNRSSSGELMEQALAAQRRGSLADAERLYRSVLGLDADNALACGNLAILMAQRGNLAEAERLFRRSIALKPNDPVGYSNLGLLLQQQGRLTEAVAAHRQAIALNPSYAEAFFRLGNVLGAQHDLDGARQSYLSAVALKPDLAEAHNNLGVLLQAQGHYDEAASAYRQASATRPGYAEAEFNLGAVLQLSGQLDAAEAAYRRAIAIDPGLVAACNNLGAVLKDLGRLEAAQTLLERAISLQPNHAEAFYNLASVLREQGRLENALGCYGRAATLRPGYVDAINNAGIILQELGRAGEAVDLYGRLASSAPQHAGVYNNMGTALFSEGRFEEAKGAFQRALALKNDFPEARYNLGNAARELGDLGGAIDAYEHALRLRPDYDEARCQLVHHRRQACAWDCFDADDEELLNLVRRGARVPPFFLLTTRASAADQLTCARQWAAPIKRDHRPSFTHAASGRGGRIRLGYLSGDFHRHATAHLMAELFERHDRSRFEVIGYSYGPDDGSAMRARLAGAFDRFVDLRALSHDQAAAAIHADGVDILIDLKGYTHQSRPAIVARRPAPVQVAYLGFPATMGADLVDYVMVDSFVVPADQQPFFSERLVYLAGCYQVNDRKRETAAVRPSRQDCGLPADGFVFCAFNNSYKISPEVFDVWMRLLDAVPGSTLWLLGSNELARVNLGREAQQRGVDPNRLVFAPVVPPAEHLARLSHADLFLDTFPCNAHTTASDMLWAGVPLLTCSGDTFASRVAGSLLTAVGMPELVTHSLGEYEHLALALARDPERLSALRGKLNKARDSCVLFDLPRATRDIEAAYLRMWQTRLSGREPAPFSLECE
ncbi:MAG: tetratricopeptide repeat protein [Bradyrhizobium sp.]|nr:tetratricopeptide repeat protein [Bradyrhizobium sp.]